MTARAVPVTTTGSPADKTAFANLVGWLDTQRRESRIAVQEAAITQQGAPGQVDATLTLRQDAGSQ